MSAASTIEQILKFVKLDEYLINFEINRVEDLSSISDVLLQEIGIDKIGHRKRILDFIGKDSKVEVKLSASGDKLIDLDDDPPPLPPKSRPIQKTEKPAPAARRSIKAAPVKTAPVKTLPIQTVPIKTVPIRTVPIKPPRASVKNLPADNYSLLFEEKETSQTSNSDNPPPPPTPTPLTPPPSVPPRFDLGEVETSIEEEKTKDVSYLATTSDKPDKPKRPTPPARKPTLKSKKSNNIDSSPPKGVDFVPKLQSPQEEHAPITSELPRSEIITKLKNIVGENETNNEENISPPGSVDIIGNYSSRRRLSRPTAVRLRTFSCKSTDDSTNDEDEMSFNSSDDGSNMFFIHSLTETQSETEIKSKTLTNTTNKDSTNIIHDYKKQHSLPVKYKYKGAQSEDDLSDDEMSLALEFDDEFDAKDPNLLSLSRNKEQFLRCIKLGGAETNLLNVTAQNNRKSKYFETGKEGFLEKKGGQKGEKSIKKRWVSFDSMELKYAKDKGGVPLQTIPLCRMKEVEIDPTAKKPTFHVLTPNRRFTFMEPNGNLDEVIIWANILTEAILAKNQTDVELSTIGGKMANPDKEGWLLKEGHSRIPQWKQRYVAIKFDKLCYYYTFDDFKDDLPIQCLEMALCHLKDDIEKLRLTIYTNAQRTYLFQAENELSFLTWKAAIEESIQYALGDTKFLKLIQENPGNKNCADCNMRNPIYASVNLMVVVCSQCIGCHRHMGVTVSKTKSLLMDVKVWNPSLIKIFQDVGNVNANLLWTAKLPPDDAIHPSTDSESREIFITEKYKDKKYFKWSEMFGQPDELGMALRQTVLTDNVLDTLKLLISGANIYYIPEESEDQRTPYELAVDACMDGQVELLRQYNGHFSAEERLEAEIKQKEFDSLPKVPDINVHNEKSGILLMKTAANNTWKDRIFMLQGRKLVYKMSSSMSPRPEENESIDLTKVEELEFNHDNLGLITLKLAKCTYILKAFLPEEAVSWYTALRNKQVMGVPIECQDINSDNIPYLIGKCIAFIEQHALTYEGIYRKSGGHGSIRRLTLLFNQDAPNTRLNIDDFSDVHAIAGLLKQYLRELPEPILTTGLYTAFTANCYDEDHYRKLERYKYLLDSLPAVNYAALRSLIVHLFIVSELADINLMSKENVMLLFGPIFLNGGKTIEQADLNYEYAVATDLLEYHEWLFSITPAEKKEVEAMIKAIKTMHTLPSNNVTTMNSLQITVYVGDTEDQMKMDDSTMPRHVCVFCMEKHKLCVDGNWALFEVIKDSATGRALYERPVHANEPVKQLALSLGGNGILVVKENYVAEKLAPFQSENLGVMGLLHYSKTHDKWKKNYYVEVKNGNVKVYSKKGASKEEDNIAIHEVLLYLWVDSEARKNKSPPGRFCFALKYKDGEIRHFSWDHEVEFDSYVAAILNNRYPTGIWTTLNTSDLNEIADRSLSFVRERSDSSASSSNPHWGRQSTYIRARESSHKLLNQLQMKRLTLKNSLFR